jgi:hypothetical protein
LNGRPFAAEIVLTLTIFARAVVQVFPVASEKRLPTKRSMAQVGVPPETDRGIPEIDCADFEVYTSWRTFQFLWMEAEQRVGTSPAIFNSSVQKTYSYRILRIDKVG